MIILRFIYLKVKFSYNEIHSLFRTTTSSQSFFFKRSFQKSNGITFILSQYKALLSSMMKLWGIHGKWNLSRSCYDTLPVPIMLKVTSMCSFLIKYTTCLIKHAVFTSWVMIFTGLKVFQVLYNPDQINFPRSA